MKMSKKSKVIIYILLTIVAVYFLAPFIYMLFTTFKTEAEAIAYPPSLLPSDWQWGNYLDAWTSQPFGTYFLNSVLVTVGTTAGTVLSSSMVAFGFARFNFKGKNILFIILLATMMIPFEAIMIPLYMVVSGMKLMNTYRGLIFPFMVSAFGVFQMRQYLLTFPSEYLDAARVDGLSEPKIYSRIVLPNCKPVIATLGILSFRNQWDNLLWPLLVAQREAMKTLPQYITQFSEEKMTDEGAMMACAFLASIPMIVLFFSLSRYFLGGAAVYESRKG